MAVGLRDVRYEAKDTHFRAKDTSGLVEPAMAAKGRFEPLFHLRPVEVHRVLALASGPAKRCKAPSP